MNYIYDILVNLKDKLYDFYDWNKNDDIAHIRKIPLFRISDKMYKDILFNKIKVDKEFLDKILNRTEEFSAKKVNYMKYVCLVSNKLESLCIKFNDEGILIQKSKLIIDENEEVMEVSEKLDEEVIDYIVVKKENQEFLKTRKELQIEKYIYEELSNTNNLDKLEYLFYECYNEKETDKNKITKKIKESLCNDWDNISYKIYDFFKLSSIKK